VFDFHLKPYPTAVFSRSFYAIHHGLSRPFIYIFTSISRLLIPPLTPFNAALHTHAEFLSLALWIYFLRVELKWKSFQVDWKAAAMNNEMFSCGKFWLNFEYNEKYVSCWRTEMRTTISNLTRDEDESDKMRVRTKTFRISFRQWWWLWRI
jgi:hypothetical protein